MNYSNHKFVSTWVLSLIIIFTVMVDPVVASEGVELCGDDGADAAETIRIIFTILSVLGPLFGTIFYVGLSVADAAKVDGDHSSQKRKVIISGFSVPIAISLFSAIAGEIVTGAEVDCFFPGYDG